jgi:uncharacterized protein YbjT (DUF2867 family)
VTGATGTVGRPLVEELVRRGLPVRALVRSEARARAALPEAVELVEGDLAAPESVEPAFAGVERAFLLPANTLHQFKHEANFIDAAKRAGIRHLVKLSIVGADSKSPGPIAQWHGLAERRIEGHGLPFTYLRPNFCMQNLLWFAEEIRRSGTFGAPVGDARAAMVDARDVAAAAAEILASGNGHIGRSYTLTGTRALSFAEVATSLAGVLGRPVRYIDVPCGAFKETMIDEGTPGPYADAIVSLWRTLSHGRYEPITNDVADILRRPPLDFDAFARDHAAAFQ